ncbi:MAG: polyprenyl diphosphate synthase [Burkholderiales bacterium]
MVFASSTRDVPTPNKIPRHVAVIMDGNGRWAKKRFLPRVAGHHRGVETVREITRACAERGIGYLTLFTFSSENWRRPAEEVAVLRQLLQRALEDEIDRLHSNQVRLKLIGDVAAFGESIANLVQEAETKTADNQRLTLTLAVNYGGRWDLVQAMNRLTVARPDRIGAYTEADLSPYLASSYAPEPDLFIRTGGEQRISNFLLWQLAYSELYFTDTLWPDFNATELDAAIASYQVRERRFGRTSEQVIEDKHGRLEADKFPVAAESRSALAKPVAG